MAPDANLRGQLPLVTNFDFSQLPAAVLYISTMAGLYAERLGRREPVNLHIRLSPTGLRQRTG